MRRVVMVGVVAMLMAGAAVALAKGADQVTLESHGSVLVIDGNGEPGAGTTLSRLADETGLFALLWSDSPQPVKVLSEAPTSDLGPEIEARWRFPGSGSETYFVVQLIYPLADGGPVTRIWPGQPLWDSKTAGGWFQAGDGLLTILDEIGFDTNGLLLGAGEAPADPSAVSDEPVGAEAATGDGAPLLAIALIVGLVLVGSVLRMRQEPRPT